MAMEKPNDELAGAPSTDTPPTDSPQATDVEQFDVNEKALLRKIDAQLLPAVGILYLLSFLDRSNGMVDMLLLRAPLTRSSWKCPNRRTC
jgi:hypothetical protein